MSEKLHGLAKNIKIITSLGDLKSESLIGKQSKLDRLLYYKMKEEYELSSVYLKDYSKKRVKKILDSLEQSEVISDPERDLRFRNILKTISTSEYSECKSLHRKMISTLKELERISISSCSISVAANAALLSLKSEMLEQEVNLQIINSFVNGKVLISSLNGLDATDFLITPLDPLVMYPSAMTSDYRFVLALNGEKQYTFRRTNGKSINQVDDRIKKRKVHVYTDSSAHLHYKLGLGIPRNAEMIENENVNVYGTAKEKVEIWDYVIAWEPLASTFREDENFREMENEVHEVIFCIFAHKEWLEPKKTEKLFTFLKLFMSHFTDNSVHMKNAVKHLKKDKDFIDGFSFGAGLVPTSIDAKKDN